jgi:hypothetical protein
MANAETVQSRSGWGGHILVAALSAVMGGLSAYFFGVALVIQYSIGGTGGDPASSYVALAIALAEGLQMALAPLFWVGIVLWFVGNTAQLRRRRLPCQVWSTWGAATLSIGYALGVLVLYPKSDFGRHLILVSNLLSVDAAVGIAGSAVLGAILGALLFALSPKWPGSALRPSGSS